MAEQKAGVDVLSVLDEVVRRVDAAMPSPLNLRGESAMHPVHHAGYAQEIREARAAVRDLIAVAENFSNLYGHLWDLVDPEGGGFLSAASVKRYDQLHEELAAALARCGGA